MHVAEHREGNAADRALRDAHEHQVAKLGEERRREPQYPVGREQRERQDKNGGLRVERVDDFLQDERHADVGELGADQERERDTDPEAKLPEIGKQHPECAPFAAPPGRGGTPERRGQGKAAVIVGHGGSSCYMGTGADRASAGARRLPPCHARPEQRIMEHCV